MPAPSPDLIVENPPPLSRPMVWPYRVNEFPADALLGELGNLAPKEEPAAPPANPNRKEPR